MQHLHGWPLTSKCADLESSSRMTWKLWQHLVQFRVTRNTIVLARWIHNFYYERSVWCGSVVHRFRSINQDNNNKSAFVTGTSNHKNRVARSMIELNTNNKSCLRHCSWSWMWNREWVWIMAHRCWSTLQGIPPARAFWGLPRGEMRCFPFSPVQSPPPT